MFDFQTPISPLCRPQDLLDSSEAFAHVCDTYQNMGGSRISGKVVHMWFIYKRVGVRFANYISFFLNVP